MTRSKVYTGTGDLGSTSLVGGARVKKNDIRIEAYGTVDELNANIGLLASADNQRLSTLRYIQNKLFNIGAYLATPSPDDTVTQCHGLTDDDIARLEYAIDEVDSLLPPLSQFIIPGGTNQAAIAHVCRTICRRCERRIITLADTTYIDPNIIKFINRLSDFLFVFARFNNVSTQTDEIFWDKNR